MQALPQRICTQLLPPQQHPQLPPRRGVAPRPVPARLIPSRLILFHPVPHRTLPTARRDPPQRGGTTDTPRGQAGSQLRRRSPQGSRREPRPPPPRSDGRSPRGSRVPAVAGRRVPSCRWVSAETRVALPGVSGDRLRHSLLLAVCFICKLLARRACCRALHRVRRCKPQASAALGTSSRGQADPCQAASLPKKPQIPVGCWQ